MTLERSGDKIRFLDTDGITFDIWTKILIHLNHLGYGMPDETSCKEYFNRKTWLNTDQSIAVLRILGEEHESKCFPTDKINRENTRVKNHFGTTSIWRKAGFLLISGELIDFSEGQPIRTLDHRSVSSVMEDEFDTHSGGMIQFMAYGNIRCLETGIDLMSIPTLQQKVILSQAIKHMDSCYVDISNHDGYVVWSESYQYPSPNTVFADIQAYFDSLKL